MDPSLGAKAGLKEPIKDREGFKAVLLTLPVGKLTAEAARRSKFVSVRRYCNDSPHRKQKDRLATVSPKFD